jgi:hypothetical protein
MKKLSKVLMGIGVFLLAQAMCMGLARSTQTAVAGTNDSATEATRFAVSPEGVITDSKTGLEWVVGPDRDTNYSQAEQWVAACKVAGGGWRIPTRGDLKSLYMQGVGERNMDPAFKTTGWWVWAEPRDSSSAWFFAFGSGEEHSYGRNSYYYARVFGVRSRPR